MQTDEGRAPWYTEIVVFLGFMFIVCGVAAAIYSFYVVGSEPVEAIYWLLVGLVGGRIGFYLIAWVRRTP